MPRKTEPTLVNGVRETRVKSGMTQQELADQVSVTRQTIVALEGESYTPSLALALRIARVFSTSVDKLFWFDE